MTRQDLYCIGLQGEYIWIEAERAGEFDVRIGARVLSVDGGLVRVLDDEGLVCVWEDRESA